MYASFDFAPTPPLSGFDLACKFGSGDLGDPDLAKNLNMPYRFLCVASFAVAILIGIGGVHMMTIPESKKRFLMNGLLFILCSTIYVAKAVRDSAEAEKLERNRKERATGARGATGWNES